MDWDVSKKDLMKLVGKRVVVDCGDSRLGPFCGLEVSGVLHHIQDEDFYLQTLDGRMPFTLADVADASEV